MIDFKGAHYPQSVILFAVYFYVRYGVSYRDLEEIMAERGVSVDHATLNCWVVKYSHLAARAAQKRKAKTADSWRMDETYVKVRGEWVYLYRAVDRDGQTFDFMLSEKRDTKSAKKFFANALHNNGIPKRITIDQSRSNAAGIKEINKMFKRLRIPVTIDTVRSKYLNNIIEQDHRFIKRLTRPMLGLKSFASAAATLAGIETANMIRKGQLGPSTNGFRQFAELAV
ncbi:IS6 family transposase [Ruegeria sp. 2205SS24-7]|uniref:IS6 family transposase n=1 Tax=Ruegeria discodermiae TaxID=3064389 RepID=UPI002741F112|nr:IS6 family transposase [Ruegeria sp. 2205SS24-7]MDP5219867.1 IS6 family transposase [Ruegeria sp. 2205SS24-7]MDP5219894.1 IS6 family transposase [Ruegeria sp. 2205SS24-7]